MNRPSLKDFHLPNYFSDVRLVYSPINLLRKDAKLLCAFSLAKSRFCSHLKNARLRIQASSQPTS